MAFPVVEDTAICHAGVCELNAAGTVVWVAVAVAIAIHIQRALIIIEVFIASRHRRVLIHLTNISQLGRTFPPCSCLFKTYRLTRVRADNRCALVAIDGRFHERSHPMSPISEGGNGKVVDGGFGEVDCFGEAAAGWEELEDEGLVVAFVEGGRVGDGGGAVGRGRYD